MGLKYVLCVIAVATGLVGLFNADLSAKAWGNLPILSCQEILGDSDFNAAKSSVEAYNNDQISQIRSGQKTVEQLVGSNRTVIDQSNIEENLDLIRVKLERTNAYGMYTCGGFGPTIPYGGGGWAYNFFSVATMSPEEAKSYLRDVYRTNISNFAEGQINNSEDYFFPIYSAYVDGKLIISSKESWADKAVNSFMAGAQNDSSTSSKNIDEVDNVSIVDSDNTSILSPSFLSSLTKIYDLRLTVGSVGAITGGSIVLVVLISFPNLLVQRVIQRRYGNVTAALSKFSRPSLGRIWKLQAALKAVPNKITVPVGILISGLIVGFLSPNYGWNGQSLRVVLSAVTSIGFESFVVLGTVILLVKRNGGQSKLEMHFGSILIVGMTVLFSRLTGFEPGIVYGLMLSVLILRLVGSKTKVDIHIREIGITFALGIFAWGLYSLFSLSTTDSNFWSLFLMESLSAITLGTLSAMPLALLPFGNLPGKELNSQKPKTWFAMFALSLFIFFIVVLPFPDSVSAVSWPFVAWTSFFLIYAAVAVLVWVIDEILFRKKFEKVS